jgi:RNA polymerase sigma-70 factor (ECF subfamily)
MGGDPVEAEFVGNCPESIRSAADRERMRSAEERLLVRCRNGDLAAFSAVYSEHGEVVYRHAYHLVGHRDDAHDIRQETFLRAFRALPTFRGDCSLKSFLLRICTNLCRDHHRSRRVRSEVALDGTSLEEAAPPASARGSGRDPGFDQIDTADLVRVALARLSPGSREVIVLRDLENLSAEETAAILGCARATVPVKLFRARRQLEAELQRLLR